MAASNDPETFTGEILVGSKIIDYLSSGLYESPSSCLKELVNNSYDADAKIVEVFVKPDADTIAIEDDGHGMTRDDFVRHFSKISESHKRDGDDKTSSGRPKVGKIGIGFIAANELCDEMEIYSTMEGSRDLLHVTIDFAIMRDNAEERRVGDSEEFKKGDYTGEVLSEADPQEHYTKIYLKRVRESARDTLSGAKPPRPELAAKSIYGLKPETVRDRLAQLDTWSSLDAYSQTRLGVALNVPVAYPARWLPDDTESEVNALVRRVQRLNFKVLYDGTPLEKPIVLTEAGRDAGHLLKPIELKGESVGGKGYLFARHGILKPTELSGILIRIRNAAVGEYNNSFLGFPSSTGQLFQRWISGEFYADDRLEEALNIDRRTLRETHPAYVEFREWLHDTVSDFIRDTRAELYKTKATERKVAKSRANSEALSQIATKASQTISKEAGRAIVATWIDTDLTDTRPSKPLNKTYTVADIYNIAIDIATDILPPDLQERFIAELNHRLHE